MEPDEVASRTFGTSFRGYDPDEVRRFLGEVADRLRSLESASADAAGLAEAEARASALLREAQEEALRLRASVDGERDRAYAEGAARAEEVYAEAEEARASILAEARAEAARLIAEAEAARERVLQDLARRRKDMRAQVEQLHAAREALLTALGDVSRRADEARGRLVVALPEAKVAADRALRRVQAEPEISVVGLESEIQAFRLAGLPLVGDQAEPEPDAVEEPAADVEPEGVDEPEGVEAPEGIDEPEGEPAADAEPDVVDEPESEPEAEAVEEPEAEALEEPEAEAVEEPEAQPEPEPEARQPEPADAAPGDAVLHDEPAPRPPPDAVDALFARLRQGREARTAAAEAVLAGDEPHLAPPAAEADAVADAVAPAAVVVEEVAVHVGGGEERAALLARRDVLLEAPLASLSKRLKRLLADAQNEVLDAIRRGAVDAPVPADLAERWAAAAVEDLVAAAVAGAEFLDDTGGDRPSPALDDVAAELADATAGAFARHLATALGRTDDDAELAADAVRSVCREWRARRLADAVDVAVRAAFGRGALDAARGTGAALCWIVDDGGAPCPDAEDNALAGAVPAGEPFPTGHVHPPAHPGCRCVLAAAVLAATGR